MSSRLQSSCNVCGPLMYSVRQAPRLMLRQRLSEMCREPIPSMKGGVGPVILAMVWASLEDIDNQLPSMCDAHAAAVLRHVRCVDTVVFATNAAKDGHQHGRHSGCSHPGENNKITENKRCKATTVNKCKKLSQN